MGRRVAKVSGTPGKTRALNVFLVPLAAGTWGRGSVGLDGPHPHIPTPPAFYFLDLPGYGYARAAKSERATLRRIVRHALERPGLAGVVWLLDIRHEPSADDRAMQDLFAAAGTPVLAAVTKSDKLPRGQRVRRGRDLRVALDLDDDQIIVTSARTRDGIPDLREAITALVGAQRR